MLPQYRRGPDSDRAKRKEKYDEALRLIQDLMDCDEFEDISTLRVDFMTLSLFFSLPILRTLETFSTTRPLISPTSCVASATGSS